jgi:hypothetical protein
VEIEHNEPDPSEPQMPSDQATVIERGTPEQVPGIDAGQVYRQARDHQAALSASSYDTEAGLGRLAAWLSPDPRQVADTEVPIRRAEGSTVLRMLLGAHLRRLREAAGVLREDAGYHIRASRSKMSRMELGRVTFKERDVVDLLELYGVDDIAEQEKLLQLVKESNGIPWYQKYQDVVPDWFHIYVGLENAARLIREYKVQFVPELLQTEEYARAVIVQSEPDMETEEVERRVALRMDRQKLLTRADPPRYWVIMDEAALRRPIGEPDVHADQIKRLINLAGEPNINLQVLPFRYGGHAVDGGAFTIMRFPETDLPDVVYMQYLTGAHYIDKPEEVQRYAAVMERLSVAGTSPDRTEELLGDMLKEL